VDIVPAEIAEDPPERNVLELPADDGWAFETGTRDEAPYAQMRLKRRLKLRGVVWSLGSVLCHVK
jgi:galactonate dehydratase